MINATRVYEKIRLISVARCRESFVHRRCREQTLAFTVISRKRPRMIKCTQDIHRAVIMYVHGIIHSPIYTTHTQTHRQYVENACELNAKRRPFTVAKVSRALGYRVSRHAVPGRSHNEAVSRCQKG